MDRPFVRGPAAARLWRKATGLRNGVTNGHEKPEVDFHHGVVPGGAIALLGKSPTIAGPFCLCGCLHGWPSSILKNTRVELSTVAITRSDLGEQITVRP